MDDRTKNIKKNSKIDKKILHTFQIYCFSDFCFKFKYYTWFRRRDCCLVGECETSDVKYMYH